MTLRDRSGSVAEPGLGVAAGAAGSVGRAGAGSGTLRRAILIVLAVAAGAGVLVAVGRLERGHEQGQTLRGIDEVRAAIGPSLTRPGPSDYRYEPGRTCLLYEVGGRIYALELCVDGRGRVVEAVDRRGVTPIFYSIVPDPGAARLHIDPELAASLVARLGG